MDYKNSGVDIEAGYKSVELMKKYVQGTMRPEVLTGLGGFSGAFSMEKFKNMEKPTLVSGTDGVGTKLKLAFLMDKHDTIGIDCVAMCVNDIACAGGEPLFFLDYIACGKNYPEKIAAIVSGVAEGCKQSDAALIGGETAEHPGLRLQPSSFISGQAFGYSDVESTGMLEMIVVVFQPFAAKAFLHMPVSEFRGMNVNTEETGDPLLVDLGRRIADMPDRVACIRLIEEFLLSRLYAFPEYNLKRVSTVLEAVNLHPHIRTAQLADVACLSNKQFGRVFAEYVGATPKEFLRIVRIQRALYTLQCQPGISFAQLAYECGFFDQSHMIKEFKFFSGYTPAEYLAVCAPYSDYFFVEE